MLATLRTPPHTSHDDESVRLNGWMKAFTIPTAGSSVVELTEVPVPTIDADELLVEVKAVGVGIHDSYFLPNDAHYPYPIGIEAAGVVAEVGPAVTGFEPGDRISFVSSMQPKGGTWAEFVAVKTENMIVPIPAGMSFTDAAAVPVAGNTVLRAMTAITGVSNGGTLFIAGASGAIGTVAIQLARRLDWRVAASASETNHDYLRSLGVELAVDYHDANWTDQVLEWIPGGVDAAMAVQPGTSVESAIVVKDGGTLVTISDQPIDAGRGIKVAMAPYQVDVREGLSDLLNDAAAGNFHIELERVYPFAEALAALAKVQSRRARGKLVLTLE